jgi:hypothetical protein
MNGAMNLCPSKTDYQQFTAQGTISISNKEFRVGIACRLKKSYLVLKPTLTPVSLQPTSTTGISHKTNK